MNELRAALLDLDLPALRTFWAAYSPHLPQAKDDATTLICAHMARTQLRSLAIRDRAYSHRWLIDHGLPSQLPDHLKPEAERIYPEIREGVGIAVVAGSSLTKPIVPLVRQAMSDAVEECYADGKREPEIVRPRMLEAREQVLRKLLGIKVGRREP